MTASTGLAGPASGRRGRILLSYATAGVAKGVAAAVQLLALPLVAMALGAERFGALLVLGAFGALCCMPARAIVASVSIGIARARGLGDSARAGAELRSAAVLSGALGLMVLALVAAAGFLADPALLLGPDGAAIAAEARGGVAALLLLVAATYFLAWVEGIRIGYEENHLNNLFTLLGSAAALAGIVLAWAYAPTIPAFLVASYALYPLVQGLNLALLPRARWRSDGGRRLEPAVLRGTARRAAGWGIAQGGIMLHLQGSIYLAAQAFGLAAGALVGGMVRLFQILHNLLLSLLNPVLPTLSHAAAAGDGLWVRKAGRTAMAVILAGLGLLAIAIALVGDRLIGAWLSLDVAPDPVLFAAFGAMALAHMAAQLFYLMLQALGDGKRASLHLGWAGLAGLATGFAGMQAFGLAGLIWGQALTMFAIALLPIAQRLRRRLAASGGRANRPLSKAEAVAVAIED